MGDCTNREDKKIGGCNDVDTDDVMDWQLLYLPLPRNVDQPRTSGSQATIDRASDLPPPCSICGIW